jgi:hypothetical protein
MDEPREVLKSGTIIRTHDVLGGTTGLLIKPSYLAARRAGATGIIGGWVAGHGGDVYWVKHDDDVVSAYGWREFEFAEDPEEEDEEEDPIDIAIEAFQSILESEDPAGMVETAGYALAQIGGELPDGADGLGRGAFKRGQDA